MQVSVFLFVLCMMYNSTLVAEGRPETNSLRNKPTTNNAAGENPRKDTVAMADLSGLEPILENVLIYDFFTTVNGLHYENAQSPNQVNELNFYYNITINNNFKTRFFTLRSYFFNEYGVRHFFDSVTIKGQDNFQIRNTLQFEIIKKYLKFQIGVTGRSQFWKTYNYRQADTGMNTSKYLYSDYFSPGYITYSCGLSYKFLSNATIDIGLAGGKITKIKNQDIFDERETTKLYGVEKGEHKKVSYGANLIINVPPRKIGKHFGWECAGTIYADKDQLGRLSGYTVDAMNVLHYMFLKNLRVSLRTQVKYDEQINDKVFLSNMLSIGFYLSNKI